MNYEVHVNGEKKLETNDEDIANKLMLEHLAIAMGLMEADDPDLPLSFKGVFIDRPENKKTSFEIKLEKVNND